MKQVSKGMTKRTASFAVTAILMAGAAPRTVQAKEWEATAGAESADRRSQALAFLPNELWIHAGDSIRWTFPTHERHTLTFLKPGQTRPPAFGPIFGILVGCPGLTPDGSSFDGSACVTSGILRLDQNTESTANAPTYSVRFPAAGNFKFVCLVHADMTGVVHVLNFSDPLPHDQDFYDRQARSARAVLLSDATRLGGRGTPRDDDRGQSSNRGRGTPGDEDRGQSGDVAAGIGEIVTTTGAG